MDIEKNEAKFAYIRKKLYLCRKKIKEKENSK